MWFACLNDKTKCVNKMINDDIIDIGTHPELIVPWTSP